MGFFNKFVKKTDKSKKQAGDQKAREKLKAKEKGDEKLRKDLTLTELKEKQEQKPAAGKQEAVKTVRETTKKEDTKEAYKYLIRPLVTEKGTYLGAQNKYIFEVSRAANKIEIKKAIKAVYGVNPTKVNIINLSGKKIRYGRIRGETKAAKKAVVTLKEGESIQVYEGV
ncbi:50S ribosomal protein L23 [Patescibacteria group bacterium]|nr:50S ribosomal protein L23 [Patescibacteria group bacterium]